MKFLVSDSLGICIEITSDSLIKSSIVSTSFIPVERIFDSVSGSGFSLVLRVIFS